MKRKKPSAEQMGMFCKLLNSEFRRRIKVDQVTVKAMLKKYGFGSLNYLLPEMEKAFFLKEKIGVHFYYVLKNNLSNIEPKNMWIVLDNTIASIRKYYANKKVVVEEKPQEETEEDEDEEFFVELSDLVIALKFVGIAGVFIKRKDEKAGFLEILRNKTFSFAKKVETYEEL